MSAKRFWLMNNQIYRIEATQDLRTLQLLVGANSEDGYKNATENLTAMIGERYRVKRNRFVAPEDGHAAKLKSLMG